MNLADIQKRVVTPIPAPSQAFLDALKQELDQLRAQLQQDMARQIYGGAVPLRFGWERAVHKVAERLPWA